ncbi:YdcF family protein [Anaerovibrio sp. RM50]|uniref:YdcF family protein n=1 Tax=Anaerovibrio sp. RM50 TaxID=1200557 RepID=UPI0018DDB03C|nr:YdcF family protein [Anaerovibrio sp. RM50]
MDKQPKYGCWGMAIHLFMEKTMITDREKIIAIVDNDCFSKSDAAVLLEGDGFFRVNKAVELYKNGLVSKIVFSGNVVDKDYGSYPFEEIKPLLLQNGVKEIDLIHENKSTQTRQQAVEVISLAEKMGWKKLALVASSDHQYRAYLTFLREIIDKKSDIILYNTPARQLKWFQDAGWGMRIDRLAGEFDRIEKYTGLGHLATVDEVIEYQKRKEAFTDESY